jgi:Fur family transcriptional regulator, ferric uptake regulator
MLKKSVEAPDRKKGSRLSLGECMEAFDAYLRRKGLRMTTPRRVLLERVFAIHDHFDADDLFAELARRNSRVSRATIYRTLELLSEAGLVEKTSFTDNKTYYEYAYGHDHHDHLICKGCGKIVEFHDDTIEARQENICRKFGFVIACHSHKIYGFCSDCRRKGGPA